MSNFTHDAVISVCRAQARARGHIGDEVQGYRLELEDEVVVVTLQSRKTFEFPLEVLRESDEIQEANDRLGSK